MRFINRQTDGLGNRPKVDPRFQQLLGVGGIPPIPERKEKEKQDGGGQAALNNGNPNNPRDLTQKNSSSRDQHGKSASQEVEYTINQRNMFVTPQANHAGQFAHSTSDQFKKDRAAMVAMSGLKMADAQNAQNPARKVPEEEVLYPKNPPAPDRAPQNIQQ